MLQDRLRQAKRKLDSSSVEHLHANKRNKTVIQVKFSKEPTCKNDTSHVGGSSKAFQADSLRSDDDANAARNHSSNSPQQPAGTPVVKAKPCAKDVKQVDQGLFVEIFSGTAGLTAAVRKVGLHSSVGIDSLVNTQCKAPVIRLDLRLDHARTLLWQILNRPNLIGVHLAPPCGTASRAREIVRRSGPSPPPLRSERWPDGFPWLRGLNRDRVKSANVLYDLTGQIVRHCIDIGVIVSVENPARSHFWETSHFSKHVKHLEDKLFKTFFHHCMHGSSRRKHTLLLHNCRSLCKLAILCDGSHAHEKWGFNQKWATSLETAYPPLLCKRYAALLAEHLQDSGYQGLPSELGQDSSSTGHNNKHSQVGADKQPRGKRIPPLVSEFKTVVTLTGPDNVVPVNPKFEREWHIPSNVTCSDPQLSCIPSQARVLRSQRYGVDCNGRRSQDTSSQTVSTNTENFREISVGIQWPPDEFVSRAVAKEHPKSVVKTIPKELSDAIEKSVAISPLELSKERTAVSRRWFLRAVELRDSELALKESLPEHCAKVLHQKRLLVFEEMLKCGGYKDVKLVRDMSKGFDLMGDLPCSNVFVHRETFATLTPSQVRESAALNRKAIIASVSRPMEENVCKGVYEATMKELEAGWITGPICPEQLDGRAVCTRRFGVVQHSTESNGDRVEKIRPIDDFTESLVNLTNGARESIVIHGVDFILAALSHRLNLCRAANRVPDLRAKTVDLRKAYKQLPISLDSLNDSFLCVKEPSSGKPLVFNCKVLPFGARAAVTGFCRASHAVWFVGTTLMSIHWSVYFDDFMVIEDECLSRHTNFIIDGLFSLLGWETSKEKGCAFDSIARALGVVFDMSDTKMLSVKVLNSPHRCKEIGGHLERILQSGKSSRSELEVIRGRLIFVESHIYGRNAHSALRILSRHIHGSPFVRVDKELRKALIFLRDRVLVSQPKVVSCQYKNVRHIYTDACFETRLAGVGGVAYDGNAVPLGFFSHSLDAGMVEQIKQPGQENVIAELEALALLAGVKVWLHGLSDLQVVLFCDNDSVLASLIKLGSNNSFVCAIASLIADFEAESRISLWFERVPSASNPADAPSRLDKSGLNSVPEIQVDFGSIVQDVLMRKFDPLF